MENKYNMSFIFDKNNFNFSCLYILTSPSGNIYIGQTQCLYRRFQGYRKMKVNKYLMNAIGKYGLENIIVEILEKNIPLEKLDQREQFYLDTLQPFDDQGYNICRVASTTRGRKRSKEEMQGSINYNKTRIGKLNHFYGRKHSEEAKQKQREAKLGKKQSDEAIQKRLENTDQTQKHKCVKQIDLITGVVVSIFESIKEANFHTGISMSNISQVANKRTSKRGEKEWLIKSAGGFYWKWCE